MNRVDLTNTGGLWTYQDTLDFLQQTYYPAINAIVTALGNNVIISGCTINGSNVSAGWLIYNGELLPLAAGALATNIDVQQAIGNEQFNDGTQKQVYYTRQAILTNAAVGVPFSSFEQIKYLSAFLNLPVIASADYSAANDNALATITALFNLKAEILPLTNLSGIVQEWGGALNKIPAGWLLCDGRSLAVADYPKLYAAIGNTWGGDAINFKLPNTLNRFTIGAGDRYAPNVTGGEETHMLTVNEMPPHAHDIPLSRDGNGGGGSNWAWMDDGHGTSGTTTTKNNGSGLAHNNMPPFLGMAKIIKI